EAGKPLEQQILAHSTLGWNKLEIREVSIAGGVPANLHDLSDSEFGEFERQVKEAGMEVCCLSSKIANWGKHIDEPFASSLEEARRASPRMKALGTRFVRIMSFAVRAEGLDQMKEQRFERVRELTEMFEDAGITALHENC